MVEQGFGDLLLRLARLKFFLRAVVNALLDVGLHAFEMIEAEAIDLMVRGAFQEESEARGKYRRARLTSAQLSTYFVGFGAVQGLVRELRDRGLSLKAAHDALLAHGSPPPVRFRALLGLDTAVPAAAPGPTAQAVPGHGRRQRRFERPGRGGGDAEAIRGAKVHVPRLQVRPAGSKRSAGGRAGEHVEHEIAVRQDPLNAREARARGDSKAQILRRSALQRGPPAGR